MQLIRAAGRKAFPIPGDVRDEAFCNRLVADAVRGLGGLDTPVHVAALQQSQQSITELTTEPFDWAFKTNVYALFWITKAAMPHLSAGSSIITTASVEAFSPDANLLDHAQPKASILAFTKSLAKQVAQQGIRVNAVAPGPLFEDANMKAIVFHGTGDIRLDDVKEPKIKDDTDVIVRITASAICRTDLHFVRGTMPG